jgi:dynein heavy chain, axonemal
MYKRKNYSTPKNYLDFIQSYKKFLYEKRIGLDRAVTRLTGGLATLEKTQGEVQILREELEVQDSIISEKKQVVEALIEDITAKKEVATKQQNEASVVKKKLDEDAIIIEKERKEAEIVLQAAQPAVEAAEAALQEVNQKDLSEVKALANPPKIVVMVCTLAFYLKEENLAEQRKDDWGNVRTRLLGNMRLLPELQEYKINKCKAEMARNAKKMLK